MASGPWACGAELPEHTVEGDGAIARDLVHEADSERRLRIEPLARDEVAPRRALADLAEREGRDHGGDDPELDLGEREHGRRVREDDVRHGDQADTAAERVSVDRRDNRRGTAVDRVEHPPERCRVGDVRLAVEVGRRAHPSDVRTRAEARPVARQDDRTGVPTSTNASESSAIRAASKAFRDSAVRA